MKRPAIIVALAVAPALVLVACASGADEVAPSSAAPSPSASSSLDASPAPSGTAPTEAPETILAVLCDSATEESVAAIEAVLKPDFTITQVVDVRTDDEGSHAILGRVEGPGYAALAQWTGRGLGLEGLAAADEFAVEVSTASLGSPDEETQALLDQTSMCFSAIHAPEDGDDKKKDDKNAE